VTTSTRKKAAGEAALRKARSGASGPIGCSLMTKAFVACGHPYSLQIRSKYRVVN
jgi:hypothetical protein